MAAPIAKEVNSLLKIFQKYCVVRHLVSSNYRHFTRSRHSMQRLRVLANVQSSPDVPNQQKSSRIPTCRCYSEKTEIQEKAQVNESELDALYLRVIVEIKGHDREVMQSYRKFVCQASEELDVKLMRVMVPKKHIDRKSLLRSVFIYKKHWTQYEMRTHFMTFVFQHLTGSTTDTFLEYIERSLPEGLSMKVSRHRLEKFPEHLKTGKTEQYQNIS